MTLLETQEGLQLPAHEDSRRWGPSLGAWPEGPGVRFRLWAPHAATVEVRVERPGETPRLERLEREDDGYFSALLEGVAPGDRYGYLPDGRGPFPDPASRSQPDGVLGLSAVVDPGRFGWTDAAWPGLKPSDVVLYEVHVGTFSPEGTFSGVRERLPYLRDLGVTAIELMPLAEFNGAWSWGYDGVDLFAPAHLYGSPDDLRALVDAAHASGIAVFLDVVYNHFGPVGNFALEFSPEYISSTHSSAWAASVNLDGDLSGPVREFFIENARHWVHEYHLDGLRLDATHALIDESPRHLVAELVARVHETVEGRRVLIFAEDHRNRADMLRTPEQNGWGLDGVWADDLHHTLRRRLAGDDEAYFRDFTGTLDEIATTINQGWLYTGQASRHHEGEARGTDPAGLSPRSFCVCIQNHDQVGNRALGERLHHQIELAPYRAASALLLTLPQTPLLFNGQEWAASSPFAYFTDHDPELGKLVTEGRRREFGHFRAFQDPANLDRIPDPQDPATFERSRLDWSEIERPPHAGTLCLYQSLLALRRSEAALRSEFAESFEAKRLDDDTLLLRRSAQGAATLWIVVRFPTLDRSPNSTRPVDLARYTDPAGEGWELVLTTEDPAFADDPAPLAIDWAEAGPLVTFHRPGAVIFRQRPVGTAILRG